jgi:cytoskeletal protein CcmA (bactofilin family)
MAKQDARDQRERDKPMGNTVISNGIVIDGEVSGEEPLTILGTVKGKIATTQNLAVEPGATVEADIETQSLSVGGKVTGNVVARERVEVRANGKMVGDIKAPRIVIADGAAFKGNVDMDV